MIRDFFLFIIIILTDRAGSRRSGSLRFCFSFGFFGFSLYSYFFKLFRRFNVSGFE